MRQIQNGRHLPDDIFKCIFLNENIWISLEISMKCVCKVPINNIPALVLIMAWRRPGDKPLSEPMMASLLTHICVTRPQCVDSELTSYVMWQMMKTLGPYTLRYAGIGIIITYLRRSSGRLRCAMGIRIYTRNTASFPFLYIEALCCHWYVSLFVWEL